MTYGKVISIYILQLSIVHLSSLIFLVSTSGKAISLKPLTVTSRESVLVPSKLHSNSSADLQHLTIGRNLPQR